MEINVPIFYLDITAHTIWVEYATFSIEERIKGVLVEKHGRTESYSAYSLIIFIVGSKMCVTA